MSTELLLKKNNKIFREVIKVIREIQMINIAQTKIMKLQILTSSFNMFL